MLENIICHLTKKDRGSYTELYQLELVWTGLNEIKILEFGKRSLFMAICKTEVSGGGDETGKYESKTCSYLCLRFSLIMQYLCFYMVLWKFSFSRILRIFRSKIRFFQAKVRISVTEMVIFNKICYFQFLLQLVMGFYDWCRDKVERVNNIQSSI